jgi:hypothetical protein
MRHFGTSAARALVGTSDALDAAHVLQGRTNPSLARYRRAARARRRPLTAKSLPTRRSKDNGRGGHPAGGASGNQDPRRPDKRRSVPTDPSAREEKDLISVRLTSRFSRGASGPRPAPSAASACWAARSGSHQTIGPPHRAQVVATKVVEFAGNVWIAPVLLERTTFTAS